MKKRNKNNTTVLKRAVAFGLSVLMCVGNVPNIALATETDGSDVVVESSSESEAMAESEAESGTEVAVDGTDVNVNVDEPVSEEPVTEEPKEDTTGATTEGTTEGSTGENTSTTEESGTEGTDSGETEEVTPTPETPVEEVAPTEVPKTEEVAEPTVTPTPTPTEVPKPEFDYDGTYNALYSWSGDYDKTRETLVRKLVNLTQKVKYHSGAGHSSMYLSNCGITDTNADLFTAENPEYLDDSGLVAWGYYQVGFKDFAQWVADYGLSGADDTDYLQSIEYAQILPGDIAVASDGWIAIYGGSLNGSPVYIGSYWAEDNGELGVCCDTEYRKDFVKFYRYTGLTDAVKEEEGTEEGTEESKVEPTETPEAETTESPENTEPTVLTYFDEDVDITATIENGETFGIEEFDITCLELKAEAIEEGTDEYNAYVKEVTKSLGDAPEGKKYDFRPYDVYFEYKGEKVEPESGNVQVEMKFKDWVTDYESSSIAHVKGSGEVENLNNDSDEKDTFKFNVSSFSLMGPVLVASNDAEYDTVGAYGMVYKSGECIIQRGNKPDSTLGELVGTVEIPEGKGNNSVHFDKYKDYISSVFVKDKVSPQSCACMFQYFKNLVSADVTNLDVSNVENFYAMFEGTKLVTIDMSTWNTGSSSSSIYFGNFCNNNPNLETVIIGADFKFPMDKIYLSNFCLYNNVQVSSDTYGEFSNIYEFANFWNSFDDYSSRKKTTITLGIDNGCAILYDTGLLSIQSTATPDSSKGSVVKTFNNIGSTSKYYYVRWDSYRDSIKKVEIHDVSVSGTSYWFYNMKLNSLTGLENIRFKENASAVSMFESFSVPELDISGLSFKNVAYAGELFRSSKIDVLDVTNLFSDCEKGQFSMSYSFYRFSGTLKGIETINYSSIKDFADMFEDVRLKNSEYVKLVIDISGVNGYFGMPYIFSGSKGIKSVQLKGTPKNNISVSIRGIIYESEIEEFDFLNPILIDTNASDKTNSLYSPNLKRFSLNCDFTQSGAKFSETSFLVKSENTGKVIDLSNIQGEDLKFSGNYYTLQDIKLIDEESNNIKIIQSYIGDKNINIPELSRNGSNFLGWYTKRTGGDKLNVNTGIESYKYYARWEDEKYTLKFKDTYNTWEDVTLGTYDEYILPNPKDNGDVLFKGWSTKENGKGDLYKAEDVVKHIGNAGDVVVLYAQYEKFTKKYNITFLNDDNSVIEVIPVYEDGMKTSDINSPNVSKQGSTFLGWLNSKRSYYVKFKNFTDSNGYALATEDINKDLVYKANYGKDVKITFKYKGVKEDEVVTVKYGRVYKLPIPLDLIADDYKSFGYWSYYNNSSQSTYSQAKEDETYWAMYGYRPRYNANGGVISNLKDFLNVQNDYNYTISKFPEVSRSGYTFEGWYLADGRTKVNIGDTIDLSKGVEITAHWKKNNTAKVKFVIDSSETMVFNMYKTDDRKVYIKDFNIGDEIGSDYWFESSTSSKNKNFKYWVDKDTGDIYKSDSKVTKDLILTAVFTDYNIKITYDPVDGTLKNYMSNFKSVSYGGSLTHIPAAIKSGFVFDGWYTEKDGKGDKLSTSTIFTEDITYYAYYKDPTISDSDSDSIFTFATNWSNTSGKDVDNVDYNLDFHPDTINSNITASLHVRFEVNKSIGENKLAEGSVKIDIPKKIFKGYNNEFVDTCNLSANLPEYPNKRSGMWFSYIENEDTYTILNNTELSGGAGLDLIVSYTTVAYKVPGGGVSLSGDYQEGYQYYNGVVPVVVTVDKNNDSIVDYNIKKDLTVEVHTSTYCTISKYEPYSKIYYSWDDSWGLTTDNDDEYFYIEWYFTIERDSINYSQLCNVLANCTYVENGEFVKFYRSGYSSTITNGSTLTLNAKSPDSPIFWVSGCDINVITRHKKALLNNVPQEGVEFKLNVDLDTVNNSGYTVRSSCSQSKIMYGSSYPVGEFGKNNTNVKELKVNGGQDKLINGEEVSLLYKLSYSGSSRNTEVLWDQENETYKADKRTIEITDGSVGDLLYSTDYDVASPYIWEPECGNTELSDSDYYIKKASIRVVDKDSKYKDGQWCVPYDKYKEDSGESSSVDLYVRYKNTTDFVYYNTVHIMNNSYSAFYVNLGENIVGVQIKYTTDSYAVDIESYVSINIKPSSSIKNMISKDLMRKSVSIIKNKANCKIWNTDDINKFAYFEATNYEGGNNPANKESYYLTSGTLELSCEKTSYDDSNIIYDAEKGVQDNKMVITGALNYSGSKIPLYNGKFYDLLPYGTFVDEKTISGYYNITESGSSVTLDNGLYSVDFIENYKDTGRTMMIISFICPKGALRVSFSYYLRNTYSNIIANGNSLKNEVAFVNTSEVKKAYTSRKYASLSSMSSCFEDLEKEYDGFIAYDYDNTHYIPVNAFSWGFDKSVKTDSYYSQSDSTLPNNEYTYKLTYAQSNQTSSKKIVFYDVLENGTDRTVNGSVTRLTPQWTGTLQNVDIESIKANVSGESTDVFCSPVIYYSTKNRSSFTGADFDVSKTDVWSTTKPSDESTITAIAVDCSKASDGSEFVLKDQKVLEVYVTMKAPGSTANYNKTTYNEAYVYSQKGTDTTSTFEHSDSDVTIKEPNVTLEKSSDPKTGTHEKHKEVYVDDTVTYTLKVTNTGDRFSLKDIIVEDVIPNYMDIDTYNMRVKFGDSGTEVKMSQSPRVSRKVDGQKLTFTVRSLSAGESAYLIIPTTVTKSKEIFDNTAKITSVNGVAKEVVSETMHHESLPIGLTFKKADLNGNYITGAKMQLLQDGSVLQEWNTTGKDEFFELKPGDYTLHEVTAPKGYILADDITFTLSKTGEITVDGAKVDTVTMTDKFDKYKVRINKVDPDRELLSGAELKVTGKENGESADITPITWTSDGGYKELELRPGTYKLKELKAPDGYKVAKDIEFIVTDEGKLTVDGEEVTAVEMVDEEAIPEKGSITIVKYDTDGRTILEGVTFNIHLVKLIDDITQGKVPSGGTMWTLRGNSEDDGETGEDVVDDSTSAVRGASGVWSDIEKTTGSDGKVVFDNLLPGVYEITETKTVSGKTLLADKITATIPMVANQDEVDEKGMDTSKAFYSNSKRLYFFFDVVYNVTNNSNLIVPVTGSNGKFDARMLFGGMLVILIGIGVAFVGKRKKEGGEE